MNPLFELRRRLNLSRVEFGKLVDKSEATIEKYEAEISPEFAAQLAKVASKHGFGDLTKLFNIAAGKQRAPDELDLSKVSADEVAFLHACLSIYRKPASEYERSVVTIVRELINLREKSK
ncbi:MAG: helix-turn-helix transcriptional regulator [Bryobacteraceae bacterium]